MAKYAPSTLEPKVDDTAPAICLKIAAILYGAVANIAPLKVSIDALVAVPEPLVLASVGAAGYGDNKLHLLISTDGGQWFDTSNGAGNYAPAAGIFRDPTIIHRPSTGEIFVAYTCEASGTHFGLIKSPDGGATWVHVSDIDVNITGLATDSHRHTFGPMLYIDPDTEEVYCYLNAFDDRIDDGLGSHHTCYCAKATSADLTSWSGTGAGTDPWALAEVSGMPAGKYAHDLEVAFKIGGAYYGLVIATASGSLGSAFIITSASPLGPWVATSTKDLVAPSDYESLFLHRAPNGSFYQFASVAGSTPVNGHLGYCARLIGGNLADPDITGSFLPQTMDVECSQGNRITTARLRNVYLDSATNKLRAFGWATM